MEGQFKEGVKGLSSGIDSGNTGRSQNNQLLLGVLCDIPQERRFTRPRLSCQEKRAARIFDDLQRLLPFLVVQVQLLCVHSVLCSSATGVLVAVVVAAPSAGTTPSIAGCSTCMESESLTALK